MRNILVITYHFPPIGGSGVQRMTKLARYLPECGWRCHVVCGGHQHYPLLDESLMKDVMGDVSVHRTLGFEPGALATGLGAQLGARKGGTGWASRFEDRLCWRLEKIVSHLRLPETELLWIPAATDRARRIINRQPIEAVLTSGPPHVAHLVGLLLKRRTGLPWIADMRDPLVGNWARENSSSWDGMMRRWLEASVVRHADAIVSTAPEVLEDLQKRHRQLRRRSPSASESACRLAESQRPPMCVWIANGYDNEDVPAQSRPRDDRFRISYVGAFYREQSIAPVLEAVRLVREKSPEAARHLEFRVIGSIATSQKASIRPTDAEFLTDCGYQPHREAIEEMGHADVLFLLTPPTAGGRLCIPAKVFEYLAFGRHVLAVVHPDTELERLLQKAGNTTILRDRSPRVLASAIEQCFARWKGGELHSLRSEGVLAAFERRNIARQYADLIDRAVHSRHRSRLRVVTDDALQEAEA